MSNIPSHMFRRLFPKWYQKLLSHPKYRTIFILGSLLYLLSPVDISPDVFPVVGWIDDGLVATLLMSEVSQLILERKKTRSLLDQTEPEVLSDSSPVE